MSPSNTIHDVMYIKFNLYHDISIILSYSSYDTVNIQCEVLIELNSYYPHHVYWIILCEDHRTC